MSDLVDYRKLVELIISTRYVGTCLCISPFRTFPILCAPPQTSPVSQLGPRNIGGGTSRLVGAMDLDSAAERMGPPSPTRAHFARRRDEDRDGRNHGRMEGPKEGNGRQLSGIAGSDQLWWTGNDTLGSRRMG